MVVGAASSRWVQAVVPKELQILPARSFFCLPLLLVSPGRPDAESSEPLALRCRGDEDRQRPAGPFSCGPRCCGCLVLPAALGTEVGRCVRAWGAGTRAGRGPRPALSSHPPALLQIMPRSTWRSCRRRPSRSLAACCASPSSTATITRSTSSTPGARPRVAHRVPPASLGRPGQPGLSGVTPNPASYQTLLMESPGHPFTGWPWRWGVGGRQLVAWGWAPGEERVLGMAWGAVQTGLSE